MIQGRTVRGRVCDSRHIELAEAVDGVGEEVEVVIHRMPPKRGKDVFEFIASLPRGNRTKEDIDRQIREERESWGDK